MSQRRRNVSGIEIYAQPAALIGPYMHFAAANSLNLLGRRAFCGRLAAGAGIASLAGLSAQAALPEASEPFKLRFILASPMYGTTPLAEVLDEAKKVGATAVDIWPLRHANHREQMTELGDDRVSELLSERGLQLGAITRYDLGTARLIEEMPYAKRFNCKLLITGAPRRRGGDVKAEVKSFVASLQPQLAAAEAHDLTIGIENHSGTILDSPDAIRYFGEFADSPRLGIALAPYHLPQDNALIADVIDALGEKLVFFQAWEHGRGCDKPMPKEEELQQLPGRGTLDFTALLGALERVDYRGWTEIFMHPTPRGTAIHATTAEVTAEINRSRDYLQRCASRLSNRHSRQTIRSEAVTT
ncbi:sugar phosphate isomerase/epimerase family protein [Lacipirellula sp.]|uniref:sugar phosphate isomerase/epimerase family protein n=1 Tax=Lacipirellula sp. TaxID=2691419 RepID=UPI003D0E4CA3